MGRTVDQEVHSAYVEFRAKEDDKCLSVQCIYCQQVRAKNTSRQKQHLLECPGIRGHNPPPPHHPQTPTASGFAAAAAAASASASASAPTAPGPGPPSGIPGSSSLLTPTVHAGSLQGPPLSIPGLSSRPSLSQVPPPPPPGAQIAAPGTPGSAVTTQPPPASHPHHPHHHHHHPHPHPHPHHQQQQAAPTQTPHPPAPPPRPRSKTPRQAHLSSIPPPALEDVHAAFVEFRSKEEDKCLSVQCIYCQQVRAKNTSRQRQHLLECPTYLNVMKNSIPANNLQHTFPDGDVARSLQIPSPMLELDFRVSIKLNTNVSVGPGVWGHRDWLSCVGGQWAGRWAKGIVLPSGSDSQVMIKDLSTKIDASYLLQTADDPPAFIILRMNGWLTGPKEVVERLRDPPIADAVSPQSYRCRVYVSMESGDDRYAFVNTAMWIGSGCRRTTEVIFDSFRVS